MILPAPLKYNDKAVIISPSGKIDDYLVHDSSNIGSWGLTTEIGRFALGVAGRFSGSVYERLYDIQSALMILLLS